MSKLHAVLPSNMATNAKLEDLNLSRDEIKRLEQALKNEDFRKLLVEYAEEISNPENRRRYEEEIKQLELERGMDVTFVTPEPGYVLKTSVNGNTKAFINISKSDKLGCPTSIRQQDPDGKNGLMWQIPHLFAPPREDRDKSKRNCQVYDFVVHPDAYHMAEGNGRFKKMVEDTALEGIEKQFGVKLDRKNIKRPKLRFKGIPAATVIRSRRASGPENVPDPTGILKYMPYPYDDTTSAEKAQQQLEVHANKARRNDGITSQQTNSQNANEAEIPLYRLVHRSHIDLQDFRHAPDATPSTRPKELVVKIELPLLNSASQADLNISEKRLLMESSCPAKYRLDLALPYAVDDTEGTAKFDKQKRVLTVTLPVLQDDTPSLTTYFSGVSGETEHDDTAAKHLIEVISASDEIGNKYIQETQSKLQEDFAEHLQVDTTARSHTAQEAFFLPDFTFSQDLETVSVILQVRNVIKTSLQKTFPSPHAVHIKCTSCGHGGVPLHYSLFVEFGEGCNLADSCCSVEVHSDNMTVLLVKDRSAHRLWHHLWAGIDSTALKEHHFLTSSILQQELALLDAAAAENDSEESCDKRANLQVLTMDQNKLTIKICPASFVTRKQVHRHPSDEDEDEEYDPPSSAEIQVIHSRPPPALHGILKQHTVSESSEDQNGDLESPRSPGEEEEELTSSLGKRRSVSFSEHIDQATFKTSAAVTSMTVTLKSKRRRQRKREERGSRRRHNSGGSEGSGDDQTHSLSDSYSLSEEEGSAERGLKLAVGRKAKTPSAVSTCSFKHSTQQTEKAVLPDCILSESCVAVGDLALCTKTSFVRGKTKNRSEVEPVSTGHMQLPEQSMVVKDQSMMKVNCLQDTEVKCLQDTGINCLQDTGINCLQDTGINCLQDTEVKCLQDTEVKCLQDTGIKCLQDTEINCLQDIGIKCPQDTEIKCLQDTEVKCLQDTEVKCLQDTGIKCLQDAGINCLQDTGIKCPQDTEIKCLQDTGIKCLQDTGINCLQDTGIKCLQGIVDAEKEGETDIKQHEDNVETPVCNIVKHVMTDSGTSTPVAEDGTIQGKLFTEKEVRGNVLLNECTSPTDGMLVVLDKDSEKRLAITAEEASKERLLVEADEPSKKILHDVADTTGDNLCAGLKALKNKAELTLGSVLADKQLNDSDDDGDDDDDEEEEDAGPADAGTVQGVEDIPYSLTSGAVGPTSTTKSKSPETERHVHKTESEEKNEHRTQCAFHFSNSVIFDLDCD